MTQTHPLELPFRGERTYLHGTDLHQAIFAALGNSVPFGPLTISFHAPLERQPDLVVSTDSLRHLHNDPAFRGEARFSGRGPILNAVIMESTRPVLERKLCNEKKVIASVVFDEAAKACSLHRPRVGKPIEQIVFLYKHLHLKLLPNLNPKWLFARLKLNFPLPVQPPRELAIALKQVLGDGFTCGDIILDGRPCGSIAFSNHRCRSRSA